MNRKTLPFVCGSALVTSLCVYCFVSWTRRGELAPSTTALISTPSPANALTGTPKVLDGAQLLSGNFTVDLRAALTEPDLKRRQELLWRLADSLKPSDIPTIVASLSSQQCGDSLSEVQNILLSSWAERDLLGMGVWFGKPEVSGNLRDLARAVLAQELGAKDPVEMFSWMEQALPEASRADLYGSFFRKWASSDPVSAGKQLRQLSERASGQSALVDNMIGQVAAEWRKRDRPGAMGWLHTMPESSAKTLALIQASQEWAAKDPIAAADYVAKHDINLIKAVASVWTQTDPVRAAEWVSGMPEGEKRDVVVASVTSQWAAVDPIKLAQWARQIPEGLVKEQVMSQLMYTWTKNNAEAASAWLQSLPAGRSRDAAVSTFGNVLDATDPDISFQAAETISDLSLRNHRLDTAANAWLALNPEAARSAIARSSLPEDMKKILAATP